MFAKRGLALHAVLIICFCVLLLLGSLFFIPSKKPAILKLDITTEQHEEYIDVVASLDTQSLDTVTVLFTLTSVQTAEIVEEIEQIVLLEHFYQGSVSFSTIDLAPGDYVITVKATHEHLQSLRYKTFRMYEQDTDSPNLESKSDNITETENALLVQKNPASTATQTVAKKTCEELQGTAQGDECFLQRVAQTQNDATCDKISSVSLRDGCYLALSTTNKELCNHISDPYQQELCQEL